MAWVTRLGGGGRLAVPGGGANILWEGGRVGP